MKMLLKNLSKKIAIAVICIIAIGVLYDGNIVKSQNKDKDDISIETEIKNLYAKDTLVEVKISTNSKELINENCFISYHVFNKTGEVLKYENERISIHLDKFGEMLLEIPINLNEITNKEIKNGAVIQFDIVDEKKAYWFSTDESIDLATASISFENNYFKRVYHQLKLEIVNNFYIFIINIVCFVTVIIGSIIIKKKHVFGG